MEALDSGHTIFQPVEHTNGYQVTNASRSSPLTRLVFSLNLPFAWGNLHPIGLANQHVRAMEAKMKRRGIRQAANFLVSLVIALVGAPFSGAQLSTVPALVNFSGTLTDANGTSLSGTVGVTFSLYKDQQGGAPLWLETQNIQPDKSGHYAVTLGATTSQGLPTALFASGEARWLGVQAQGQAEQSRILLLSVPYALKAGDAQTIGGLPPSAFVLAPPSNSDSSSTSSSNSNPDPPALGGSGQTDYLPIWTNSSTLGDSVLFQSGVGAKAKVGIGTTKPASTLDVKGGGTIRGLFSLPATGTATASGGFNSQPIDLVTSVFNSGTSTAVPQTFQWQAEPVGNNTKNASGSLNLLFGQGTNKPSETGLNIASNGQITFAKGQTFPGTGNGTITGVTAGTDLTGGGNTGNVTLNVDTTKVVTAVTAGTDLTGGGNGGSLTLNLDTTKVPQLAANNSFTGNESVSGSVTAGSFAGNGASLTNVNAAQLGGLGSGAFAQLNAINNFTQTLFAPQLTSTGSAEVDNSGSNWGNYVPGLQFGPINSGETIASAQASGSPNQYGLDFYTNAAARMSITNVGQVGIGVQPIPTDYTALYVYAPGAPGVWGTNGNADGIVGNGAEGGTGVSGWGGFSTNGFNDGPGGVFQGGTNFAGGDGIDAYAGSGMAGYFAGDVFVNGNLSKNGGSFKIDHPLDPANKYLYHSFVESPDMKNIYDGVATLDANGEAVIQMPQWFGVLNRDFRYQLTCIGGFAPVYIAEELANNQFRIGGGRAGMKVSWQITGIRQDAWANAHRIPVEEQKNDIERGFYTHPELYGAPEEKQIEWARHPQLMKKMQEHQLREKAKQARLTAPATR
jgi:hypothetical protein